MRNYLEFEAPIKELNEQIQKLKDSAVKTGVNVDTAVQELEKALLEKTEEIYKNLDPWQKVQLSRHPDRPYALEYIESMTEGTWIELHGDRTVKDDKAMIGGFGLLNGESVMFIRRILPRCCMKCTINSVVQHISLLFWRDIGKTNPLPLKARCMEKSPDICKGGVVLDMTPFSFPMETQDLSQKCTWPRKIYFPIVQMHSKIGELGF